MNEKITRVIVVSLLILVLGLTMNTQIVNAITIKKVVTWAWGLSPVDTRIYATVEGDVDGDGKKEIVTVGTWMDDYECHNGQLCVWDAVTLALEGVKSWIQPGLGAETWVLSVAIGDVDSDGKTEIVTGGFFSEPTGYGTHAQIVVWDGATLAFKKSQDWIEHDSGGYERYTYIMSIAVGDVDGDGKTEIVTGGYLRTGTLGPYTAQLCVWDGTTLANEEAITFSFMFNWWIHSVAIGDVDGDGKTEIVTGGYVNNFASSFAYIWIWDGATLLSEKVVYWQWTFNTYVNSVAVGDVDADGQQEIVSGGAYFDGTRLESQLCVWGGANLNVESVKVWFWTGSTQVNSVAVGDVDGDAEKEIVTGGTYGDGHFAQLCVWSGATLALKGVQPWIWYDATDVVYVNVGEVDGDGKAEMVTGGEYADGWDLFAQLCVWDW